MLLVRILDELLIIRDNHDDLGNVLVNRDTLPRVRFIIKNNSQRSMFILNNYRMPGLPISYFKDLFYDKDNKLDKIEELIKNHADNPFDKKELKDYYIKDKHDSDFIAMAFNFGDGLLTTTSIHYNTTENRLFPRESIDKNFVYGYNDRITRRMSIYTDKYTDDLSNFLATISDDDSDFEEKWRNQIIHHIFTELLHRYNELVPYKVKNGWRINLSKLSKISSKEFIDADYNGLFKYMDCLEIFPKKPEKSYEDLRREYFEKKALKLLETSKPKTRRKRIDKNANNKTTRKTRGTRKQSNDTN